MDTINYKVDNHHSTYCISEEPLKIHVIQKNNTELLIQDFIANISYPIQSSITPTQQYKNLTSAGVVVLPIENGGRGPIINYGEAITIGLLLDTLVGALGEDHLHAELKKKINSFITKNSKNQYGYASHNDTVTLNNNWVGYFPDVVLGFGYGETFSVTKTIVGEEPDCVEYREIHDQECIFGHSGLLNNQSFTIKAAILTKAPHTLFDISWVPATISGVVANQTTESSVYQATNCMGLRVKGTVGLVNPREYDVSGIMLVQISVDDGSWRNIAGLRWSFKANENLAVEEDFDVLLAYDQDDHNYKFRGYLIVDSDEEPNRLLTGFLNVDTVTQVGSGTILSNDLVIKWTSKE